MGWEAVQFALLEIFHPAVDTITYFVEKMLENNNVLNESLVWWRMKKDYSKS